MKTIYDLLLELGEMKKEDRRKTKKARPEDSFTRQVLKYARLNGWKTIHIRPGRTKDGWNTPIQGDGIGFPDLLMIRGPEIVVAELKCGKNKVNECQRDWLKAFEEARVPAYWWYPKDWEEIESVLARK